MPNIFEPLKNVPVGAWEIINITETEVTLRRVETKCCPCCGHVLYSGEEIKIIPRKRYEEHKKRMSLFNLFK